MKTATAKQENLQAPFAHSSSVIKSTEASLFTKQALLRSPKPRTLFIHFIYCKQKSLI